MLVRLAGMYALFFTSGHMRPNYIKEFTSLGSQQELKELHYPSDQTQTLWSSSRVQTNAKKNLSASSNPRRKEKRKNMRGQKKKGKKNTHADLSPEVKTQVLCC